MLAVQYQPNICNAMQCSCQCWPMAKCDVGNAVRAGLLTLIRALLLDDTYMMPYRGKTKDRHRTTCVAACVGIDLYYQHRNKTQMLRRLDILRIYTQCTFCTSATFSFPVAGLSCSLGCGAHSRLYTARKSGPRPGSVARALGVKVARSGK